MVSKTAIVRNEHGIHCRPSAVIAKEVMQYDGEVHVSVVDNTRMDARNILGLISLGATCGQAVRITVSGGRDEEAFCQRMVDLFETQFDFPPRHE